MNSTKRSRTRVGVITIVVSMIFSGLALPNAEAAGPPYGGPVTADIGPAYFGPAPNPFPYCENPIYFDPFPENVNPIGRIDVTGAPNAAVTTNDITMTFELTAEGDVGGQYPGFFPFGADGSPGDQPKGVEMASDDQAVITLSEPMFYTQWVFTDVDRDNEGFVVTPAWGDPASPGQIAVFGGDPNFIFTGTSNIQAVFNDTDTVAQDSEAIEGRVQVDVLGPATGISLVRDTGSGQSGFAIGGGCEPIGVSKEVTSPPTWNGSSFDVTYTIRVRNNLPLPSTISDDITAALLAAASGTTSGVPLGIDLQQVTLEDLLTDAAFSSVDVVSNVNTSGNVAINPGYNGVDDINLLADGETIGPESEEEFVLTVQYTPDVAGPVGATCSAQYTLSNQARVAGVADGVDVEDLSDSGPDPDPGVENAGGETDDPTIVTFDCPPTPDTAAPPAITLSKTVLAGADADCASAVEGVDEFVLGVTGDPITWCFLITNTGGVPLTNVSFTDTPAGITDLDVLADSGSPVLAVDAVISFSEAGMIPASGLDNVASVVGEASLDDGTPIPGLPLVSDENTAAVNEAAITLAKTVAVGADADCATSVETVSVNAGAAVTYCFLVVNTGGVTVRVDEVNDVTLGITVPIPAADRDLSPGDSVQVAYSTTALVDLTNVASVIGVPIDETTGDPYPDAPTLQPEDPAEVDTLEADLSIVKSDGGREQAVHGNVISYSLVVDNAGPDAAANVVVVDTLPAGLSMYVAPTDPDWSCESTGAVMTCAKTTPLPALESATLEYTVLVERTAPTNVDLVNTATVTSDTPDPDPSDNEDTETTVVVIAPPPPLPPDEPLDIVIISNPPPGSVPPGLLLPPNPVTAPPTTPLAVTGSAYSGWFAMAAAAMASAGGVLLVGGRRRLADH